VLTVCEENGVAGDRIWLIVRPLKLLGYSMGTTKTI